MDAQPQSVSTPETQTTFMAPPARPGQAQPWKQWYQPEELDTEIEGVNDKMPQQCSHLTQAVTAV
ncbi:predicted protein [Uncinocarpus reesii 1704]|uniref:Uncharacterized protein n=1 Tax=Uncinocarpus reesii (strain UAMH 1704) TaxID=336963 RepID=C4JQI4_UNCRE|nr:uncharacterized protein UREG_03329 [Uncinocarpus reesii 1704]EEP78483.1 predicted protein [Uncinocarpus reesii 1704]